MRNLIAVQRGSALARHPPGLRSTGARSSRDLADHSQRAVSPAVAAPAGLIRADNTVTTAAISSADGCPLTKASSGGWS
jgi:hypothetical protein